MILATVGLYAVVAFSLAQRVHELGARVALGAQSTDVVRLTISRGIAPALAGIVVGIVLALLGGKLVAALLFDVSPRDPQVLAGVSAVLLIAATLACVVPGLKAARVDPIVVLRAE